MRREWGRRLYRWLLRLLPGSFRERFGPEIEEAFDEQWRQPHARGPRLIEWLALAWDVIRGIPREHWRVLVSSHRRESPRLTESAGRAVETWIFDAWQALRLARREPAYGLRIVLLLALAIGATTAITSVVDGLLFRPLPGVKAPERIRTLLSGETSVSFSYPDVEDLAASGAFAALAAYLPVEAAISNAAGARTIRVELVSPEYFSTLRMDPLLGSPMLHEGDDSVVIGYSLWRSELGSEPAAVGSILRINGHPFTVAGVLPPGFAGVSLGPGTDAWIGTRQVARFLPSMGTEVLTRRGWRLFHAFGRLAEGIDEGQAQAGLDTATSALDEAHPNFGKPRDFQLAPLTMRGLTFDDIAAVRRYARMLMALVFLVLGVVCVNVVGLLGIRDLARSKDSAVRVALGAGRWQLARLRLVECAIFAIAGGAGGAALAWWSLPLLSRLQLPFGAQVNLALDSRSLLITLTATGALTVAFGLVSGIASGANAESINRSGMDSGRLWPRIGAVVVPVQVALSVMLLVGAGLLLRTLSKMTSVDRGFSTEGVMVASLEPDLRGYSEEAGRALLLTILERVARLPGVEAVSVSSELPLSSENRRMGVWVEGRGGEPDIGVDHSIVAPGYFRALDIPLRGGRDFEPGDDSSAPPVVIVNESFARHFWPEGREVSDNVSGRRISVSGATGPFAEIVGVVANHRDQSLRRAAAPHLYWSFGQVYSLMMGSRKIVVARALRERASLAPELRSVFHELDSDLPIRSLTSLDSVVAESYRTERQIGILLAAFGSVAVIVTVIGLYGMLRYALERRTREVGIRLAIGARPGDVSRLFLQMGLRVVATGLTLGLSVSAVGARYLSHVLYETSPTDPSTLALVALVTLGAGASASYLPARRASRVDPTVAVRWE